MADVQVQLPCPLMKIRKTIDQCFQDAGVVPKIFLESQSTELFISLYPYDYGIFFCTQMRLPMLLSRYPDANVFPLAMGKSLIQHRLVLAYHEDRFLPEYAHDFMHYTEEAFAQIAKLRPRR